MYLCFKSVYKMECDLYLHLNSNWWCC